MGLGIGNGIWWSDNYGGGGVPATFHLMTEDSRSIITEDNAHLIIE